MQKRVIKYRYDFITEDGEQAIYGFGYSFLNTGNSNVKVWTKTGGKIYANTLKAGQQQISEESAVFDPVSNDFLFLLETFCFEFEGGAGQVQITYKVITKEDVPFKLL